MSKTVRAMILAGAITGGFVAAYTSPAGATTYAHPKLANWYLHQGGKRVLAKIEADLGAISTDAGAEDLAATGSDCVAFGRDIHAALALRPIPVPSVEKLWRGALRDYGRAATACVNGTADASVSELQQSANDAEAGNTLVTRATAAIG